MNRNSPPQTALKTRMTLCWAAVPCAMPANRCGRVFKWAPKGVLLETEGDIARNAKQIYLQAGVSHAMPPANVTYMEPEDREAIVRWFRNAGS